MKVSLLPKPTTTNHGKNFNWKVPLLVSRLVVERHPWNWIACFKPLVREHSKPSSVTVWMITGASDVLN